MIEATKLTVWLSGKPIVRDVSLRARPGEFTAIAGPNGSGKTTTLKALAGELPFQGHVTINGHAISELKPWQLSIKRAVLPQASVIAFPFTVREIVQMGLTVHPHNSHATNQRIVTDALQAVDLEGFAGRFYQELSGGEQQRVQLARVLCQIWEPVVDGEPCYLLLDEPVSSLDIRHQLAIMALGRRYCERGGGVIAVMHDLNLTAMFADHMIMMKDGQVAAAGSPRDALTDNTLQTVFGCQMRVNTTPAHNTPFVLPHTAAF